MKIRYLMCSALLLLGSISYAHAGRTHTHHTYVVHDVYVIDTRPPLVNTAPVAGNMMPVATVAPARCDTSATSPAVAPIANYHTQNKFLVSDDSVAADQGMHPKVPGQQVQLNYYDQ